MGDNSELEDSVYHQVPSDSIYFNPEVNLHQNPKTPISQYRFFTKVYNLPSNLVNGIKLEDPKVSPLFELLYPYKSKTFYILRCLIPTAILGIILFLSLQNPTNQSWMLIAAVVVGLNLIYSAFVTLKITETAEVARNNKLKLENPLSQMIYSPTLSKKKKLVAAQYEVEEHLITSTGLSSEEIELLRNRVIDGKVTFMAYNDKFKRWSNIFHRPQTKKMAYDFGLNFVIHFTLYVFIILGYLGQL